MYVTENLNEQISSPYVSSRVTKFYIRSTYCNLF